MARQAKCGGERFADPTTNLGREEASYAFHSARMNRMNLN
jgi:hypothetical protein